MEALKVFSHTISFFKHNVVSEIEDRMKETLADEDLFYVLTIPSIWTHQQQQFIKEAALQVK